MIKNQFTAAPSDPDSQLLPAARTGVLPCCRAHRGVKLLINRVQDDEEPDRGRVWSGDQWTSIKVWSLHHMSILDRDQQILSPPASALSPAKPSAKPHHHQHHCCFPQMSFTSRAKNQEHYLFRSSFLDHCFKLNSIHAQQNIISRRRIVVIR